MLVSLLLDHIDTAQESATPRQILVVEIGVEGHDRRVGVVGMQDHQFLLTSCSCRQSCQQHYI